MTSTESHNSRQHIRSELMAILKDGFFVTNSFVSVCSYLCDDGPESGLNHLQCHLDTNGCRQGERQRQIEGERSIKYNNMNLNLGYKRGYAGKERDKYNEEGQDEECKGGQKEKVEVEDCNLSLVQANVHNISVIAIT